MAQAKCNIRMEPDPNWLPDDENPCVVWECESCGKEYYIYIIEDGDINLKCLCGAKYTIFGMFKSIFN